MSSNTFLKDVLIRSQIMAGRFSESEIKRINAIFDALNNVIVSKLGASRSEIYMLNLLPAIRNDVAEAFEEAIQSVMSNYDEFSIYEAKVAGEALNTAVAAIATIPTDNQVIAAIRNHSVKLIAGKKLKSMTVEGLFRELSRKKQTEISGIIRNGATSGRTLDEMIKEVQRVIDNRTKNQIASVIRTSTNAIQTAARRATFEQNEDLLKGEQWVSVLDMRTSNVCASRDGNVYLYDQGEIAPPCPAHYGCRSNVVPLIRDEYKIPNLRGERASMTGPVSDKTTYQSWLKTQPESVQNEVLGITKAKLFRTGELTLDKFVDDSGISYTLDELKSKYPVLFAKIE